MGIGVDGILSFVENILPILHDKKNKINIHTFA